MNEINLKVYLSRFQAQNKAGIITNKHGVIIEANEAAAELLNMRSKDTMKNNPMVSFVHRNTVFDFKNLINECCRVGRATSNEIKLRPRGEAGFRAELHGEVIAKSNQIILINWILEDAELKPTILKGIGCESSDEDYDNFQEYLPV